MHFLDSTPYSLAIESAGEKIYKKRIHRIGKKGEQEQVFKYQLTLIFLARQTT